MLKVMGNAWPTIQALIVSTAIVVGAVAIPALIMYATV